MTRWKTFGVAVLFASAITGYGVFNQFNQTGVIRIGLFDLMQFIFLMLIIYVVARVTRRTKT
jgi:hypothetical protein